MEINELNFESYALDYAEGTLKGGELAAMQAFLTAHPEWAGEIAEIAGTALPFIPDQFQGKDGLKRRHRPVAFLPLALAFTSAACLVLAIGFIWLLGQHQQYGELAAAGDTIVVHGHSGEGLNPTGNPFERIAADKTNQVQQGAASMETSASADHPVSGIAQMPPVKAGKDRSNRKVTYPESESLVQIAADQSRKEQRPVQATWSNLDADPFYVVPVTIEMHELSVNGNAELRTALNESMVAVNQRAARRQLIKDGTIALVQEKLLPTGVLDFFSN